MSNSITLVSAQGTAAQAILTLLADARLLGSHKHVKLSEARKAIIEVLPKLYAELNRQEGVTRKNMHNVAVVVYQMRGRSSWATHDDMMATIEADLEAFITGAYEEMVAEPEAPKVTIKWKSGTHKNIAYAIAYGYTTRRLARRYGWRRVTEVLKTITLDTMACYRYK